MHNAPSSEGPPIQTKGGITRSEHQSIPNLMWGPGGAGWFSRRPCTDGALWCSASRWCCGEPPPQAPTLETASLGYIKGSARTATLLCILVWMHKMQLDVKTVHPRFHEAACDVKVVRFECPTLLDQALQHEIVSVAPSELPTM